MPIRVIKKYENHKHYDGDSADYVSMMQIGEMVARGEHVQVIVDRTGEDVTLEALARSLYDHLRVRKFASTDDAFSARKRLTGLITAVLATSTKKEGE
jgi:hypothetical protein